MDKIEELLTRGVANILPNKEELRKLLLSKKRLNIYFGIDPTSTHIHLGHGVPLRKLQAFANLGHNVTLLIGDFTALIGDTSDKDKERPSLTPEEIKRNFKTYKNQAQKILDFSKIRVRYNSEWLKTLTISDAIRLGKLFSTNDFVSRELIQKRLTGGKRVGLHEVLYPLMQGYDSYYLNTDIQLGGTDQTFNMQAGRTLQKILRKKESFIIANVFLEDTDGRKMSKTLGNAIWLTDKPQDMYAKIMAINDNLIVQYFTLETNVEIKEIERIKTEIKLGKNPMEIKKELARIIVTELHSEKDATDTKENFEKVVQRKEAPSHIPEQFFPRSFVSNATITDALERSQIVASRSQAKRVIAQGGTAVYDTKVTDPNTPIAPLMRNGEIIVRVGKRNIVKIGTES